MIITVSESFYPLLENASPYLLLCGGGGSGKSEFAGRKVFYRCQKEGNHKIMIMRKIRSRLRESVITVMLDILEENEIKYTFNRSDRIITFYNAMGQKSELLFDGLDDPEKIKSIKGITSYWLEEMTEFTKDDFTQIDLRLRGVTKSYKQIMGTFNPDEAAGPWIKEKFFADDIPKTGPGKAPGSYIHHSTIEDNPVDEVREEYRQKLDALGDKVHFDIYRLGHWAIARGIIYNWDVVDKPKGQFYDEIFYGLDFGYSVNPAAVDRIYRKADEFWIEEVIHQTKLTNMMIGAKMGDEGIGKHDDIYADSAEPKSIDEIAEMGFNVKPCQKGKDSVKAGIDFLKSRVVHIIKGSEHVIAERKRYRYKEDKEGNPLPEPVKLFDHHMDAIRYAIHTHCKEVEFFAAQVGGEVY